ncbi:MAG: hypothetical protein CMB12_03970 [Euryarchaeota archaeon]|nr:hypothetical protein [Euryarchaeota archaeon]
MVNVNQGSRSAICLLVAFTLFSSVMMGFLVEKNSPLDGLDEVNYSGPSGAGSTNATILNTTYLSGNHAYDNLQVGCATTGSSCGSIVANGSLILTVNTLTVSSGASIIANAYSNVSQGLGTSIQLSTSWMGSGAGGAGHYSNGGSGGGTTSSNGGISYGVSNESGSNGGSIYDSNGNLISDGGIGGGHIVIYADSIEIYGTVSASGADADPGYRYNNGSGTGGPGAGGGSGGSVVMRSNLIEIYGSILAQGGDGGDGEDGDCLPGSACLFMYDGGDGGGGGSGGNLDIRANSTSNLLMTGNAILSASSGSGGSAGAPYGTGAAGVAGSNGGAGNSTTGTWSGWSGGSGGSGGGGGPASASTPDSYEPNDTQATATWGNATTSSSGVNSTSWSGLTIHNSTDEDWFCFWVNQSAQFWFNITFVHANGDIDMTLYDGSGNTITSSTGVSNSESVSDVVTSSGFYCVRVYGYSSAVNYYNATLEVESYSIQAQNDAGSGRDAGNTQATAVTLSGANNVTYSGYLNHISDQDDYYAVYVPLNATISASMQHNTGLDFDLWLRDANGTLIDSSSSTNLVENVTSTGTLYAGGSTYYLHVDVWSFTTPNTGTYTLSYFIVGGSPPLPPAPGNVTTTLASNLTYGEHVLTNLTTNTSYSYEFDIITAEYVNGSYTLLNTTSTRLNVSQSNFTIPSVNLSFPERAGVFCLYGGLFEVTGQTTSGYRVVNESLDCLEIQMLDFDLTSDTDGIAHSQNLTAGDTYSLNWSYIEGSNYSTIDSGYANFTATGPHQNVTLNWTSPISGDPHCILLFLENSTGSVLDSYIECYSPIWPRVNVTSMAGDRNATLNEVIFEGTDLIAGDSYDWNASLVEISNFSNILDTSGPVSFTASSANMSGFSWNYTTPSASGYYCVVVNLENSTHGVLDMGMLCMTIFFDDDWDGVWNENDLCPNTSPNATVDLNGCDATQRDTDGDGYVDASDDFPFDSTQWSDGDGDGFGDNPTGNNSDAFPTDGTQWSDQDGDGYGDNTSGNNPDAFPTDSSEWEDTDGDGVGDNGDFMPGDASQWADTDGDGYGDNSSGTNGDAFPNDITQWSDQDGDGYGDNASGNDPDEFPTDGTQWEDVDGDGHGDNASGFEGDQFPTDPTQWSDGDGDGYGDNASGNNPDVFPEDSTQWADRDGDGYGDNRGGNNGDAFPDDSTQWSDTDGDGYGDNPVGNNPDIFPNDGTQWADADGDGYGDNPSGNDADAFPSDSSQWSDIDGDGYGDNQTGTNPDDCPNTPSNARPVDSNGCHISELDTDGDSVTDDIDVCPQTPSAEVADDTGCSPSQRDTDGDGIKDNLDQCPGTPSNDPADQDGCGQSQIDDDGDGVMNDADNCPSTDVGLVVDSFGCASNQLDSDNDGVTDDIDQCAATSSSAVVDGDGCADSQKDTDDDGLTDDKDLCPDSDSSESVDINGCADSQKDSDMDSVNDADDNCPGTPGIEVADALGCSPSQKDTDDDGVNNALDNCPQTVDGAPVNSAGCANYERDTDGDGVKDDTDLCPSTLISESADLLGCGPSQKDTDGDGVKDSMDDCDGTLSTSEVDDAGCSITQRDTDGDGVNDSDDAFPSDPNESSDRDGDGVGDVMDAYPDNPEASIEGELDSPMGLIIILLVVTVLVLGGGSVLLIRFGGNNPAVTSGLVMDGVVQQVEGMEPDSSNLPGNQPEQFVDADGNHWTRNPDGSMLWWNGTEWQQV